MIKKTITQVENMEMFPRDLTQAMTSGAVETLLAKLPIVDEHTYQFSEEDPARGWKEGFLHWVPIGRKRGNAGQISLAKRPINPLAERLINGMEAIIEMMRQQELLVEPDAPPPMNPREAVQRYFKLPPLEQIPLGQKHLREQAREIARRLTLQLKWDSKVKEFAILIRDRGIGQAPARMHRTLLSLGSSDKADKPYLIGVFGQGGSSTYAASKYSWILSRRAQDLLNGEEDGVGWSIVKHIIPPGSRSHYFAYLAAHPDGRVPCLPAVAAQTIDLEHGSWFAHIDYDFGGTGRRAAVSRNLYQALNHVLYNPVLPFDTDIVGTPATIYGNAYRLSNLETDRKDLDKTFDPQPIA